jgi:hypothetical protein
LVAKISDVTERREMADCGITRAAVSEQWNLRRLADRELAKPAVFIRRGQPLDGKLGFDETA